MAILSVRATRVPSPSVLGAYTPIEIRKGSHSVGIVENRGGPLPHFFPHCLQRVAQWLKDPRMVNRNRVQSAYSLASKSAGIERLALDFFVLSQRSYKDPVLSAGLGLSSSLSMITGPMDLASKSEEAKQALKVKDVWSYRFASIGAVKAGIKSFMGVLIVPIRVLSIAKVASGGRIVSLALRALNRLGSVVTMTGSLLALTPAFVKSVQVGKIINSLRGRGLDVQEGVLEEYFILSEEEKLEVLEMLVVSRKSTRREKKKENPLHSEVEMGPIGKEQAHEQETLLDGSTWERLMMMHPEFEGEEEIEGLKEEGEKLLQDHLLEKRRELQRYIGAPLFHELEKGLETKRVDASLIEKVKTALYSQWKKNVALLVVGVVAMVGFLCSSFFTGGVTAYVFLAIDVGMSLLFFVQELISCVKAFAEGVSGKYDRVFYDVASILLLSAILVTRSFSKSRAAIVSTGIISAVWLMLYGCICMGDTLSKMDMRKEGCSKTLFFKELFSF